MTTTPFEVRIDTASVSAALARAPRAILDEMVPAIVEGQMLLERETKERTPTSGAGTLRDSIGALPIVIGESSVSGEVGSALPYALPIELGARPHRPPIEPLADWVRRKLGKKGKEARGIAFAIADKIARDGMPARHMATDALAASQAQILAMLAAAAERGIRMVAP